MNLHGSCLMPPLVQCHPPGLQMTKLSPGKVKGAWWLSFFLKSQKHGFNLSVMAERSLDELTPKLILRFTAMEAAFLGRQRDEVSSSESQTRGCCLSSSAQGFGSFQVPLASRTLAQPKPGALAQECWPSGQARPPTLLSKSESQPSVGPPVVSLWLCRKD